MKTSEMKTDFRSLQVCRKFTSLKLLSEMKKMIFCKQILFNLGTIIKQILTFYFISSIIDTIENVSTTKHLQ